MKRVLKILFWAYAIASMLFTTLAILVLLLGGLDEGLIDEKVAETKATATPEPEPILVYLRNVSDLVGLDYEDYENLRLEGVYEALGPELEVFVSPKVYDHIGVDEYTVVHIGPQTFEHADYQLDDRTQLLGGWVTKPHPVIDDVKVRLGDSMFSERPSDVYLTCERHESSDIEESVFRCEG